MRLKHKNRINGKSCYESPASVCGWYFAHPKSHYFGLGKIAKDQLEDYAKRKSMSIQEAENGYAPILNKTIF